MAADNIRLTDTTPPPAAPSGLTAAAASASQVTLKWTDNSPGITQQFEIDRSTSSTFSSFTPLTVNATSGQTSYTYSDAGSSANTTYYYRVDAISSGVNSSYSPVAGPVLTGEAGTPVSVTVPDGNFANDTAGHDYLNSQSAGAGTITQTMTGALSGWTLSASPSTANSGNYSVKEPFGQVDGVSNPNTGVYATYLAKLGNQPGSSYKAFTYFPGELGSNYDSAQPGASLTMTTNASGGLTTAVTGGIYTATIQYANMSCTTVAQSATVTLNILDNGVVVASSTLPGLAINSPWTPVTATWVPQPGDAQGTIQLQVVANNFLEGNGNWTLSPFAFANATLTQTVPTGAPPTVPSGLTAMAVSSSQINLSWTDNSNNETGFNIDQSTSSDFSPSAMTSTMVPPEHDRLQRNRPVAQHHVLLSRASHYRHGRFCQHIDGQRRDASRLHLPPAV